jgi:hypothetical protein
MRAPTSPLISSLSRMDQSVNQRGRWFRRPRERRELRAKGKPKGQTPRCTPRGPNGSLSFAPYGSGASGRGDFKIEALKPLPPPSLELLCVSSGTNLETNGSHRGTCVLSDPIRAPLPTATLQRVPYEVCRGPTDPIRVHEFRRHALSSQAHKTASILSL